MTHLKGPFTRAHVRQLAHQQGYRIASPAQARKTGLFAEVWVWGWDPERQRIITCRFYASREHPAGHCNYAPVSDTVFIRGGVRANQLGLNLDWKGTIK